LLSGDIVAFKRGFSSPFFQQMVSPSLPGPQTTALALDTYAEIRNLAQIRCCGSRALCAALLAIIASGLLIEGGLVSA
jgi:hypothetical protein